jgi:hypothetical protein
MRFDQNGFFPIQQHLIKFEKKIFSGIPVTTENFKWPRP